MKEIKKIFEGMFDVDGTVDQLSSNMEWDLNWIQDRRLRDSVSNMETPAGNTHIISDKNWTPEWMNAALKIYEILKPMKPPVPNLFQVFSASIEDAKEKLDTYKEVFEYINMFAPAISAIDKYLRTHKKELSFLFADMWDTLRINDSTKHTLIIAVSIYDDELDNYREALEKLGKYLEKQCKQYVISFDFESDDFIELFITQK